MDWTVKNFIDAKTGKPHRLYRYKNKVCGKVFLKSRLCDQLAGWSLIEKDLRSATSWMDLIDKLNENAGVTGKEFHWNEDRELGIQVKGLFVAALTFYFKCFSKCEGRPVKLERAQLDENYREVHDHFVAMRHNFAAHNGAEKHEYVNIALVMPLRCKKGKPAPQQLYMELFQPDAAISAGVEGLTWQKLFEHCRSIVERKRALLVDKILEEEVAPKGADYWIKRIR